MYKTSSEHLLHSTEAELLKFHYDKKCTTALVVLDLSAASDVIEYRILQKRLEYSYQVSGSALSWIESCLGDRSKHLGIGLNTSEDEYMNFLVRKRIGSGTI